MPKQVSENKSPHRWKTLILVVVVLLLAVAAGVGGSILTSFSIFPYLAEVPYFQEYLETDDIGHTIFKVVEREKEVVSENEVIYDAIEATKPAVVTVVSQSSSLSGNLSDTATGFIVSADGLVVTNKHMLLDDSAEVKVIRDDYWVYEAEVVSRDPLNDIALLKIEDDNLPVANLYPKEEIRLGQQVIAVGSKYEKRDNFVSLGVLSAVNKGVLVASQENLSRMEGLLETDAVIGGMDNGGPLINLNGEVIGLNARISATAEPVSYAIPVSLVRSAIDSYIEHGYIRRSSLGVRWQTVTPDMAQIEGLDRWEGAWLVSGETVPGITPGGPADKAGLKTGDIIHKIAGQQIDLENGFMRLLQDYEPGSEIELSYIRDNEEITVKVKVGESR